MQWGFLLNSSAIANCMQIKHQPHRASEAYSYVSAKRPDGVGVLFIAKPLDAVHLAAEILLLDGSTLVVLLLTARKSNQNLCISVVCYI